MMDVSRVTVLIPQAWGGARYESNRLFGNMGTLGGTFVEMGEAGNVEVLRIRDADKLMDRSEISKLVPGLAVMQKSGDSLFPEADAKVQELLQQRDPAKTPSFRISVDECLRRLPSLTMHVLGFNAREAEEDVLVEGYHHGINQMRLGYQTEPNTMTYMFQHQERFDPTIIANYRPTSRPREMSLSEVTSDYQKSPIISEIFALGIINALYQLNLQPEDVNSMSLTKYLLDGITNRFDLQFRLDRRRAIVLK